MFPRIAQCAAAAALLAFHASASQLNLQIVSNGTIEHQYNHFVGISESILSEVTPSFTADFTARCDYTIEFLAPPGKLFRFTPPPTSGASGDFRFTLEGSLDSSWTDQEYHVPPTAVLLGASDSTPALAGPRLLYQTDGRYVKFEVGFGGLPNVPFTFKGIRLTGSAQFGSAGQQTYPVRREDRMGYLYSTDDFDHHFLSFVDETPNITEFRNGYLTFTNANPALYYRVEFKPNLTDPVDWDGSYLGLRNIHSPDAKVTVPVGVFYRVVGRETPWVAGTASASDLLSGKTAFVNDVETTGTMANVGQQNVMPGTAEQAITAGYHNGHGSVAGDADLVAENIKKDVVIFGVTGTHEGAGALPKTGQTTSYRTGDDGDLEKGVAPPSPRFTVTTNGADEVVTDNLTGLMWVKAPHSLTGNSVTKSWTTAVDFCNGLTFAGHSDWRLPNVREQLSLIDYGYDPALPSGHPFTGIGSVGVWTYWSSTTHPGNSTYAFWVDMGGKVYSDLK